MAWHDFDVAIVGGGFAGSLLAMVARRMGKSVLLVERERHPRFVIGESSTPLANLLMEEIAVRHDLPRLLPLCKWGAWQAAYPDIACGLKRGFSFYHHGEGGIPWVHDDARSRELMVAASPTDAIADTHWYRPDFDAFLFREAAALGVEALEGTVLGPPEFGPAGVRLQGRAPSGTVRARARWLFDATGPRGYLHRALGLGEVQPPGYPATEAVYGHFTGVERWESVRPPVGEVPFSPDDAALHHVFGDGWGWVLRFNNGVTSAGFARRAGRGMEASAEAEWGAWLRRCPEVERCFAGARAVRPVTRLPRVSFRTERAAGPGWLMLPIAAGFVDPLLSMGFPLTLLGVLRIGEALGRGGELELGRMGEETLADLDAAFGLVGALYRAMPDFDVFRELLLMYFTAAIWSETARRLGKAEKAPGFLLRGEPLFAAGMRGAMEAAIPGNAAGIRERVRETIRPFDLGDLLDDGRRHRHGCELGPLIANAGKMGATQAEMREMLARSLGEAAVGPRRGTSAELSPSR